jgi:hypothetical protein
VHQAKLQSILGASAEVFNQFTAPPKKKKAP